MASEIQQPAKAVEGPMKDLKVDTLAKACNNKMVLPPFDLYASVYLYSGPKDGSTSDATSCVSLGDVTSSTKESDVYQEALMAEQGMYYPVNGLSSYYYPGFDGSFGEWDAQSYFVGDMSVNKITDQLCTILPDFSLNTLHTNSCLEPWSVLMDSIWVNSFTTQVQCILSRLSLLGFSLNRLLMGKNWFLCIHGIHLLYMLMGCMGMYMVMRHTLSPSLISFLKVIHMLFQRLRPPLSLLM